MINKILELLIDNNISEYRLIKELNFNENAFRFWRNGRQKPSLDALVKIADYFGVSLDYLVGREGFDNKSEISTLKSNIPSKLRSKLEQLNDADFEIVDGLVDTLKSMKKKANTS